MTRACRRCGQPWVAGDERCPACGYTSWLSLDLPVPEVVVTTSTALVAPARATPAPPPEVVAPTRPIFVPTSRFAWILCLVLLAMPIFCETLARILLVLIGPTARGNPALVTAAVMVLAAFVATRLLWPMWLGAVACAWWAVALQRGGMRSPVPSIRT